MEERDRLHEAYTKSDDVAEARNASAAAMAQLQADREAALATGGPTPEELELERQKRGIRIQRLLAAGVKGEDIEAALAEEDAKLAGRDKRAPRDEGNHTPQRPSEAPKPGGSLQDALAAAVDETLADETEDGWWRGGEAVVRWAIAKADDHDGATIAFQVILPGEEDAGVVTFDVSEQRILGWNKGLQNVEGPRNFAYGLMSKFFGIASQHVSAALHGALTEVQEGLHLQNEPRMTSEEFTQIIQDEAEDEAPPMSAEARAFLMRNAEQGEPEVVSYGPTPEELERTGQAAQAAIEEAMKNAPDEA